MSTTRKKTNPIERMERALRARFPASEIEIDPAATARGGWFLDVRLAGHHVVIEWRPDSGFGVTSNPDLAFGDGADEHFTDEGAARSRVIELLETRGRSLAPSA